MSKYHISHVFKDNMGMSVHQYLVKKRLDASKNSILSGMPFHEVATAFGFRDYTSFFRAFKKEFGVAPREFKGSLLPGQQQRAGNPGTAAGILRILNLCFPVPLITDAASSMGHPLKNPASLPLPVQTVRPKQELPGRFSVSDTGGIVGVNTDDHAVSYLPRQQPRISRPGNVSLPSPRRLISSGIPIFFTPSQSRRICFL